eukprot:CAMPEP_0204238228 /NCGR_PEP_ID=MMETSP0361-20130328/93762_1 /ASSEMBLY_ACC=CAM_ASM_000343 /TAXON_ID=268821 /ORGANISM="Scrippsiella Hangoei, Strain SHTV-5" /LENGTH=269 /DNA_ID=CAMNT_0051210997 /DNA_START=58 /DNA_END=864 /DNA_ORIENTATION=+
MARASAPQAAGPAAVARSVGGKAGHSTTVEKVGLAPDAAQVAKWVREEDRRRLRAGLLLSPDFAPEGPPSPRGELQRRGDGPAPSFDTGEVQRALRQSAQEEEEALHGRMELELAEVLAESERAAAEAAAREDAELRMALEESWAAAPLLPDSHDDPLLFEAALQASRIDLGPRGPSQPARILAMMAAQGADVVPLLGLTAAGGTAGSGGFTSGGSSGSRPPPHGASAGGGRSSSKNSCGSGGGAAADGDSGVSGGGGSSGGGGGGKAP